MKKVWVISLGGSLIIPDSIDYAFLDKFKKTLRKHYAHCKFIIVCGGGSVARKYISALKAEHHSQKELSLVGIRATRMNALFLMQFFGPEANETLPLNMHQVKNFLQKNSVVICGALRYTAHSTSDSTSAKLASFFKSEFINMTNVKGLYTSNPLTNKNAKFIPRISWKEFESLTLKIKFHAGQHYVLDQQASVIIKNHKVETYIIGKSMSNLDKILHKKKFIGTVIS